MTNDPSNLGVVVDLAENPFADLRVLFHATSLLEGKSAWLLKQARRKTYLADVVDEPAKVSKLLVLLRQTKSPRCPGHRPRRLQNDRPCTDRGHLAPQRGRSRTKDLPAPRRSFATLSCSVVSCCCRYRPCSRCAANAGAGREPGSSPRIARRRRSGAGERHVERHRSHEDRPQQRKKPT